MNMKDRVIERAAQLLVDRFLADEFGTPDAKPAVDGDGDLHCPDCPDRVFVTRSAYRQHRTKSHHEKSGDVQ